MLLGTCCHSLRSSRLGGDRSLFGLAAVSSPRHAESTHLLSRDKLFQHPLSCTVVLSQPGPGPKTSGKQSQHSLSVLSLPLTDHGGDVAVVVFSHTLIWGTWLWKRDLSPSTKCCWSPPGKDSQGNADASPPPLCSLGCFIFPLAPTLLQHKGTFLYPSIFFFCIFAA